MILTPSVDDPSLILVSELSVKQAQEVELFRQRYGDRDLFALGNVVCRPDGSLFIQGALSTYISTELEPSSDSPAEQGPEERAVQAELRQSNGPGAGYGLRRQQATVNVSGGMMATRTSHGPITGTSKGQPGHRDDSVPHTPIPSLTVYREKWVERTYEVPGGQVTLRRLRAAREGRGM